MKKLGKLSLKQMEHQMLVVGSDEQEKFIGGSGWEYINGRWSYVLDQVNVWGQYAAAIPTSTQTMTYLDWSNSNGGNLVSNSASFVASNVPGLGMMHGAISDKLNSEKWQANSLLINAGVCPSDSIRFNMVVGSDLGMYYDLYRANGNFIGTTR